MAASTTSAMMPALHGKKRPDLYDMVVLAEDVEVNGSIYRAGTHGQIVEVHRNNSALEVEFISPYGVITLQLENLKSDA